MGGDHSPLCSYKNPNSDASKNFPRIRSEMVFGTNSVWSCTEGRSSESDGVAVELAEDEAEEDELWPGPDMVLIEKDGENI